LVEFPRIGHAGRVAGTYEWVVRGLPHIIVYQTGAVDSDEVLILGVFHAAQDREPE
jgi:plasmid stabilization system protein ParE